ncbi:MULTISPECIES: TIR domain-containing protein [Burkholderiaceae]|uniref:TIR domain-containing protein n=1 Tax=Burkholderia sp. S171 TaxID=1641860 RepID=UPI001C542FDA
MANAEPEQYQPRARQNVAFEFGFFAGSLGLKHVCALIDGPVEKPSDIDGLVYVSRAGEWRIHLAREMKAAGLPIDASKLI